jgi:uncharacterized protein involved in exopolysaccharide biosynthesis
MIGPLITLLRNELRRIWCYRWLVAVTSLVLWAGAAAYIQHLPSTYDAWGQIYVEQQTPLVAAAEGVSLVGKNYGSPYVVQTTLLNDDSLEKIVRRIDPAAASKGDTALAGAVNRLRAKIRRAPDPGDGFIELHVTDTDPVRARDVVQLLMQQFISTTVGRSQRDLGRAGEFLEAQIASYGSMLEDSQANIAAFRQKHPAVAALALAGHDGGVGQLGAYAEPAYANASQALTPPPPSRAAERVAELEARLASLRTAYTEQYPDVVTTRRQLSDATAALDREERLMGFGNVSPPGGATMIPERRAAMRPGGPRRLAPPPPLPPDVAAAWADLQKTDELLRANYQQLLVKQAATRMSQAVYRDDEAGKYQIVREPVVPVIPTGPNRPLYLTLAAVLAIGAGMAAGYLRAAVKGILVSRQELEETFQLPVIGTVSWEPAWHTARAHPARGWLGRGARALPRRRATRRSP